MKLILERNIEPYSIEKCIWLWEIMRMEVIHYKIYPEKILHSKQTSQLSRNSNSVMRLTWTLGRTKLVLKIPLDQRTSPSTITDTVPTGQPANESTPSSPPSSSEISEELRFSSHGKMQRRN